MNKSWSDIMIGLASDMTNLKNIRWTYCINLTSYLYYCNGGTLMYNGRSNNYSAGYKEGDELVILLDMFKGELQFFVNGVD